MKNLIKGIVVSLFVLKLSKHPFKVPTSTITCSKSKVEVLKLRLNLVGYKMQPPFLISTFKYVLVSRRYVRRWGAAFRHVVLVSLLLSNITKNRWVRFSFIHLIFLLKFYLTQEIYQYKKSKIVMSESNPSQNNNNKNNNEKKSV